jgi:hypothetical protein
MGDRAYMEVVCRREDAGRFEDLGFCEQEWRADLPNSVAFLVDEEANYGHNSAIQELSAKGVVFCARHDEGGDYHAVVIASDGPHLCQAESPFGDGRPCIAVLPDGSLDGEAMQAAKEYYAAEAAARRALGIEGKLFPG